ncbi:extracellular solute-binding protein [Bacillus sp. DNRA2]|uniref:ABC transporter substrate-binding protein n=1 Tax=Bacillus sp. DNRA2 TaxID=2723053 RepID=UPI00145EB7F1|nr:extracellular solute-binding protein [Bacillus sp. DNRA2]NMD71317.1 extracellular solute-binding protein [Bacillus sp. DNRA2]
MKSRIIFLILLTIFLASCSSDDTANNKKDSTEKLSTISIIADSEDSIALFKKEEENIKEKFGVKLEYHYPSRLNDNLEDFLFASKKTYDIYILFPGKIPEYVTRDMLLPLDDYIKSTKDIDDILPVYRNLYMKFNNHDYGMVYDGDTHLLFYRKDIFKKYNEEYKKTYGNELTPPETWEEYDQIAKFLTKDTDKDGEIDLYGTAIFGGEAKRYIWFAERFTSMGGRYFDEHMKPLITTHEGIQALQELIDLNDSGSTPPNSMYDWIDLNNAFLHGEIAMTVQWSDTGRFSYDTEKWGSTVQDKVGWTLVPTANPNNPRGGIWIGRVLSISKKSTKAEKAWDVISYITSKKVSQEAISSLETINDPFRYSHFTTGGKGAFPNEKLNERLLSTVKDSLKNPNADMMIPSGWEYMQVLDDNIAFALLHKLTAKQALEKTAEEWEEITDRVGRNEQSAHYQQWLRQLEEVKNNDLAQ